jgi:hypothetical protein
MSANGPAPEVRLLTIEELIASSETTLPCPFLSVEKNRPVGVRVRKIGRAEYISLLPPLPPDLVVAIRDERLTPEDASDRERAWVASLPADIQEVRRAAYCDLNYHLVAIAAIEPKLTVEQARLLGDDAIALGAQILTFSGIVPVEAAKQTDGEARKPVKRTVRR